MKTPWKIRITSMIAAVVWMVLFEVIGLNDVDMTLNQRMTALLVPLIAIVVAVQAGMLLYRERRKSAQPANGKRGDRAPYEGPGG